MQDGIVTVSYLPTKEDYAEYKAAAARSALKEHEIMILRLFGMVFIAAGICGAVFMGNGAISAILYSLVVLVGASAVFYPVLVPQVAKKRAAGYFEANREKMLAATLVFTRESIKLNTDRYTAEIPYRKLFRTYENEKSFLFYTGIGESFFFPKRAASEEGCERIREMIRDKKQA